MHCGPADWLGQCCEELGTEISNTRYPEKSLWKTDPKGGYEVHEEKSIFTFQERRQ